MGGGVRSDEEEYAACAEPDRAPAAEAEECISVYPVVEPVGSIR
jgi:hypothetical protein